MIDPYVPVPDSFLVRFETSKGTADVMVRKNWSPAGADRFYTLVKSRYYDEARFFRVVPRFVAQFGLADEPRKTAPWRSRPIADEPVKHTNSHGTIAYARGGPGTRTTQVFFNLVDNPRLDTLNTFGFPPFGEVVSGIAAIDSLYSGYGNSPSQDSITRQGNPYLNRAFPKLDYMKAVRVIQEWRKP
jgi:peptidyl-prolyl cis-trans isomerase A (cyclophilin A)